MKAVSKHLNRAAWLQPLSRRFDRTLQSPYQRRSLTRLLRILVLAATVMALNVISYTLASSLFVSNVGAQGLPISYILVGLASSPVYGWFSHIVDDVSHQYLFRYWALVTGSLMLLLRTLLFWDVQPIYYALFVGVYFLWTLQLDILLPTLISDYFTSREYKRFASFITVSQALGGFAGGLLVSVLAKVLSTDDILLLVPALYLVVFALVWNLQYHEKPVPPEESDRHAEAPSASLTDIVRQYPIVKLLAAAAFLWIVLYGIAEYLYFDAYATYFAARPDDLTAFLGGFSAFNSILQVLLLLFVTRRLLLGRVGVDGTNPIYPLTTALSFTGLSLGLATGYVFPAAIFAHLNSSTFDTAINQPVYTLMYNPIPNRYVAKVRALTDGLCYALGLAVCGSILWIGRSSANIIMAFVGLGLGLVFVLVRHQLSRNYFQAMATRLVSQSEMVDLETMDEIFQHFPENQMHRLLELLRSGNDKDCEKALRLAVSLRVPSRILPDIEPLILDSDMSVRRALLRFFAKTRQDLELSRFLWEKMRSQRGEGRLFAFEALVARREPISNQDLETLSRSPLPQIVGLTCVLVQQRSDISPELRQRCAMFWETPMDDATKIVVIRGIRNTGDATTIPQLRNLLQDASVDVQVEVLKGLAQLGAERDVTLAELGVRFLDHPNPVVRGAAIDLLGAVQLPQLWDDIARGLEDTDIIVRGQATKALARYEDYNLDRLAQEYLTHNRAEVAEAAVAVLAQVKTSQAFLYLEEYLEKDYLRADLIRRWWQQIPSDRQEWQPLVGVFRDRTQKTIDRVFHVLSCLGNRRTLMQVRQLLEGSEKRDRDNALETLETIPHRRYALRIVPLIEQTDRPTPRVNTSDEETRRQMLEEMFSLNDNWLRAGALRVWSHYRDEIPPALQKDRDRVVQTLVRELSKAPTPKSQADLSFDRVLFLKTHVLFQELSLEELWSLDRGFQRRKYEPGDRICQEGELGSSLMLIYHGRVTATSMMSEDPMQLNPGCYFGDFGLFGESPYTATACAETEVMLLCLAKDSFDVLVDVIPKLTKCMGLAVRYSSF